MNVVDTSGWLEFFAGGPNADMFAAPITQTDELVIPVICIYEVSKVILRESDEGHLMQALAVMQQAQIVDLTSQLAVSASKISLEHKLPMADSMILATANSFDATLWTQDIDFKGIDSVKYIPKKT